MQININDSIEQYKGLVYKQLKRYNLYKDSEAESRAFEALWIAIKTYNPEHESGAKLETYANKCISNALGTYARTLKQVKKIEEISLETYIEPSNTITLIDTIIAQRDQSIKIKEALDMLQNSLINPIHIKLYAIWEQGNFEESSSVLARKLNCSQPHVHQILAIFKHKIREALKEE